MCRAVTVKGEGDVGHPRVVILPGHVTAPVEVPGAELLMVTHQHNRLDTAAGCRWCERPTFGPSASLNVQRMRTWPQSVLYRRNLKFTWTAWSHSRAGGEHTTC